ncbi:hypothetical protein P1P68_16945 [Streptomyces scabiei]|uniref:hypothetical protein n=1 Tax=Streptomyces scabiei TaxID=1930 RepID=UPI00298F6260|nr:hypothetical protein [Streptomyces scabiei]MDW8806428.1 hypothetical protein [Streptomyces scabiei]
MAGSFSRRRVLTTGAGAALGGRVATGAARAATASAAGSRTPAAGAEETRHRASTVSEAVRRGLLELG